MPAVRGTGSGTRGATFDLRTDPPLKEFEFRLSRFADGITDFTEMWQYVGGAFRTMMKEQFKSEGALGSGRWTKLSDDYRTWKERHYPGQKIGHLSGALRASMTGGAGYSEHRTPRAASFGMDLSSKAIAYGHYFSEGTEKMPARPVIVATKLRGTALRKATEAWVRSEAHHAGLIGTGSRKYQQSLLDETAYLPST